jgi:hypothetical protein
MTIQPIDRSRAHVALARAFNIPANPDNKEDRQRVGWARALALYAGKELPLILHTAEWLDFVIAGDGGRADIDFTALQRATGLDTEACEVICLMIGARQRSFRDWTTAEPGESDVAKAAIKREELREWMSGSLPEKRERKI